MAAKTKTTQSDRQPGLSAIPPEEGLQRLFSQRRSQLHDEYSRFIFQGDEESLHDFRVALRRLRSLLRNYRKIINLEQPLMGQLRELQGQTNLARDREVFIAQLQQCEAGHATLCASLQQQLQQEYQRLHRQLPTRWELLLPLLDAPLMPISPPLYPSTFGRLARKLGRRQLGRLVDGLQHLQQGWDEALLHRLRIRGKRLRYLLEPFASESGGKECLEALKAFQDELGNYRDLQLLLHHLETIPAHQSEAVQGELYLSLRNRLKQLRKRVRHYRKQDAQQALVDPIKELLKQLKQ